jgi:hypothetical protein
VEIIVSSIPIPVGACLVSDDVFNFCSDGITASACAARGGVYQGDGSTCLAPASIVSTDPEAAVTFVVNGPETGFECSPLGSCEMTASDCMIVSQDECMSQGGVFTCGGRCFEPPPPPDCNDNGIDDCIETEPEFFPPNSGAQPSDVCELAEHICPRNSYNGTTAGHTGDLWQCGLLVGNVDAWYRYRPSWSGLAHVGLQGPPLTFIYEVWEGCPDQGGTQIACTELDHFTLSWYAEQGKEYYLRVAAAGFNVAGPFVFELIGPDCCPNPNDCLGNRTPDDCECPADVVPNGFVGLDDFLAVQAAVGQPCHGCPADVDGSGEVNAVDLQIVILSMGPCPNVICDPESLKFRGPGGSFGGANGKESAGP